MADEINDIENMSSGMDEITDDDKLWAALAWLPITPLWPIIAIVVLVMEDKKARPFIKYHAVMSLLVGVVGVVLSAACVGVILLLAMFYFAFKAYQGEMVEIPVLSDLARNQGWV